MRAVIPSDSDAISDLESLLFDNSMGARMIRQELRLGAGWVEGEDSVIGYILTRTEEGICDITRLGVHPNFHHQGIGSALLTRGVGNAETAILTVKKDNVNAMKLYLKYGFEIIGHLQKANTWIMKRCKNTE